MADIQIPAAAAVGRAPPRRRTGQAPTVDDVALVRPTQDPGLRVPRFDLAYQGQEEAFASEMRTFSAAGAKVAAVASDVMDAVQRQQREFDAIKTTEAELNFKKAGQDEYLRLQAQADTTDPSFEKNFGEWLSKKRDDITAALPSGISDFSRKRLDLVMTAQQGAFTNEAGKLSLVASQQKSQDLIQQQTNLWSAQAANDPKAVESILANADEGLKPFAGTMNPNLERDTRAKARQQIILGAVEGAAAAGDFTGARNILGSGTYDAELTQPMRATLERNIRTQETARFIDEERKRALAKQAVDDASKADEAKVIADATPGAGGKNPNVTAAQIADPNGPYKSLLPAARLQMISYLDRQNRGEPAAAVSHSVAVDLVSQIRSGQITDMRPIFDAYTQKDAEGNSTGLTNADFAFVRQTFADAQTPDGDRLGKKQDDFLKAVKPSVDKANPLMGKLDMTGGVLFYQLQQDIAAKVAEYRKANKDPFDLFNPAKPDFLGKPEFLSAYQKSIPESLDQVAARLRAAPATKPPAAPPPGEPPATATAPTPAPVKRPPREANETMDDYLKRVGLQ